MIYVTSRDDQGYETTREHADPLDAARDISAVRLYANLHLAGVEADSKNELAGFRAYCAKLKPAPVTW